MALRILANRLSTLLPRQNARAFYQSSRNLSSNANEEDTTPDNETYTQKLRDEDTIYETSIKLKILDAALPFVMEKGWSKDSLALGAESLGYPGVTHGLFPRGGVELVYHFYTHSNSQLTKELEEKSKNEKGPSSHEDSAPRIMRGAVESRLRMNVPYVLAGRWTEALGLMALPQNAADSLRHLGVLVDDIWHHAGDRSSNFSWYTKRAALAGVYKSTELYMLQDYSADFEETWHFLDRRMSDLKDALQCEERCSYVANEGVSILSGLVKTALNMANMNSRGR